MCPSTVVCVCPAPWYVPPETLSLLILRMGGLPSTSLDSETTSPSLACSGGLPPVSASGMAPPGGVAVPAAPFEGGRDVVVGAATDASVTGPDAVSMIG